MNQHTAIPKPAMKKHGIVHIPIIKNSQIMAYALVDNEYEHLDKYYWHLTWNGYAMTKINGKRVRMHRLIMQPKDGQLIDHVSMNKLDNRKSNLRIANHSENKWNKPKQSNNTSGYKGVYRRGTRWVAKVVKNRVQYHAGTYRNPIQAARAYDAKASELFGEFAKLNFERKTS